MSEPSYRPMPGPSPRSGSKPSTAWLAVAFVAVLLGSALIGLAGGVVWAQVAPRVVYVVTGRGQAYVVNPETTAFIAGDAWYCLVGAVGGLIIGLLGYFLAVRRFGPVPMAAVLAGSVIAGLAARWVGQQWGLAHFQSALATARQGTLLRAPLVLGGVASQWLWPAIVFWPLAACLLAGGFELVSALRAARPSQPLAWQAGWPGGTGALPAQQPGWREQDAGGFRAIGGSGVPPGQQSVPPGQDGDGDSPGPRGR